MAPPVGHRFVLCLFSSRGRSSVWLERRPVTPEVEGSNPFVPATVFMACHLQRFARPFFFMAYCVYIIQSQVDGGFYVGSTRDIDDRLERHNTGRSRYTRAKRPWKLVYKEDCPDRSSAIKRELEIKNKKKRTVIESLIRTSRP